MADMKRFLTKNALPDFLRRPLTLSPRSAIAQHGLVLDRAAAEIGHYFSQGTIRHISRNNLINPRMRSTHQ
jgi:hypothetical protein